VNKAKRILVVYPTGHLYASPGIQALIGILPRYQYEMDVILVDNKTSPRVYYDHSNINMIYTPLKQHDVKENKYHIIFKYIFWLTKICTRKRYDLIIAAGERGLLATYIPAMITRTPYAFYCLEIMFRDKSGIIRNTLARMLNKKAIFTTIQDAQRAKLLVREHGIKQDATVIIPNAINGKARRVKSTYLHRKYDLKKEDKVILCASGMMRPAMIKEEVEYSQFWPNDHKLVVHSGIIYDHQYKNEVLCADKMKRTIFSFESLSQKEMDDLVSSADIGVAFYDENASDDYKNIGLASGKIAQYLRNGIPIIINQNESINAAINQHRIGLIVEGPSDVTPSIVQIITDFDEYVNNCVHYYDTVISPDSYYEEVNSRIEKISY